MQPKSTAQNGSDNSRHGMAAGDPVERALHILPGPVDESEFAEVKAALEAEILFPKLPWELDVVDDQIRILSGSGKLLATVHDASAASIMATAAKNWLLMIGLLPLLEQVAPDIGRTVLEELQLSLGMEPVLGGASKCDAHSGEERDGQ